MKRFIAFFSLTTFVALLGITTLILMPQPLSSHSDTYLYGPVDTNATMDQVESNQGVDHTGMDLYLTRSGLGHTQINSVNILDLSLLLEPEVTYCIQIDQHNKYEFIPLENNSTWKLEGHVSRRRILDDPCFDLGDGIALFKRYIFNYPDNRFVLQMSKELTSLVYKKHALIEDYGSAQILKDTRTGSKGFEALFT